MAYATNWHMQQVQSNMFIHSESCFCHLMNLRPIFTLLVALFLNSTNSWGKYLTLKLLSAPLCSPASVCLLFAAEHGVYIGFMRVFIHWRLLLVNESDGTEPSKAGDSLLITMSTTFHITPSQSECITNIKILISIKNFKSMPVLNKHFTNLH